MSLSKELQQRILEAFALDRHGIHGPVHWQRVRENGLFLAAHTGADVAVVEAFAWLHDSCRHGDGGDAAHGHRAADFALGLHDAGHLDLVSDQLALLERACRYHSDGRTEAEVTVQVCWDADRLDLGRVGSRPDARYLCTEPARRRQVIRWAFARSVGQRADVPQL